MRSQDSWQRMRASSLRSSGGLPQGDSDARLRSTKVILLTGATGPGRVGAAAQASGGGARRCAAWSGSPRRLGPNRVRVQITARRSRRRRSIRQAVRGVRTVVHLGRRHPRPARRQHRGAERDRDDQAAARGGADGAAERFVFFWSARRRSDAAHALLSRQGARGAGGAGRRPRFGWCCRRRSCTRRATAG